MHIKQKLWTQVYVEYFCFYEKNSSQWECANVYSKENIFWMLENDMPVPYHYKIYSVFHSTMFYIIASISIYFQTISGHGKQIIGFFTLKAKIIHKLL